MRFKKTLLALPLIAAAAACTNTGASYQPVIDGPVDANYAANLSQCQNLASQQGAFDNNTAGQAVAGAAIGGGTAALVNNKGTNARDAALVGAAVGLTAGALDQQRNKESIIKNCMRQRGYNVVG
jgi:hypothetical protein